MDVTLFPFGHVREKRLNRDIGEVKGYLGIFRDVTLFPFGHVREKRLNGIGPQKTYVLKIP